MVGSCVPSVERDANGNFVDCDGQASGQFFCGKFLDQISSPYCPYWTLTMGVVTRLLSTLACLVFRFSDFDGGASGLG